MRRTVDEPLEASASRPWIQAIYVTANVLMPDEANAMLNKAGVVGRRDTFNKCFV